MAGVPDREPIFVTRPYLPPKDKFLSFIDLIWENKWLTNQGPLHNEFADSLKKYLGVEYITLMTNGHLALEAALSFFNFPKGSEVITTPFTFASTSHAIARCGLEPVFCDIKLTDLTIDENKIEDLITPNTVAIMPVHVYGHPCAVAAIQKIADKHGLKVIYDAAHAFGVKVNKMSIGCFGDISMFSFHATKLFHSIEGGALVFSNPEFKRFLYLYKNFGIADEEHVLMIAPNAKMNEFQAAMGLCGLQAIDSIIDRRHILTEMYKHELASVKGVIPFNVPKDIEYNYAYFPILIDKKAFGISRNELYKKLKENNIFARKYFYPLIPHMDCYREKYTDEYWPTAEYAANCVLTLPLYHELEVEQINRICEVIKKSKAEI